MPQVQSRSPVRNIPLADILVEARETYARTRPEGKRCHEEACRSLPGGNTRTVLFHGPYPLRARRGSGAYLEDTDGHRYVNLLGEYTAGLFGHDHPRIRQAVTDALDVGINLGAHNPLEPELAALVTQRFPAIERVRFTNSGTEANLMAIVTARHVTGRDKVMVFAGGYHGGVLYFKDPNAPINAPFEYVVGTFNDANGAAALIRQHGDALACVIVEPMIGSTGCIPGKPEFLSALRTVTEETGALLIFDEVMTSRFGSSGAGAMHAITPDLMTLGKWVGGGMSFGAFGGRADIMSIYDPTRPDAVAHAGTFNNNVFTMSAGIAALRDVFDPDTAHTLHARGDRLRDTINALFDRHAIAMHASGCGSLMNIHGMSGPIETVEALQDSDDGAKELLFLDLLERGFYIARRGFIALSLVIEDHHLDGFTAALDDILHNRRTVLPQRV